MASSARSTFVSLTARTLFALRARGLHLAPELRLKLLHRRLTPLKILGKLLDDLRLPPGNTDRLFQVTQRVLIGVRDSSRDRR